MDKKILIVGSTNTDMVIKTTRFPMPGETILGGTFFMNPGGKGANQAVAAARLGGNVTFVGKIGNDIFGLQALNQLKDEGIIVDHIATDLKNPSGIALITVNEEGENCIIVASGSNGNLSTDDIDLVERVFEESDYILMQLEIPVLTVEYCAVKASDKGIKVILNPAPARRLSDNLLKHTWLITPNETEAEILTGIRVCDTASAGLAASSLYDKGVKNVIITMGAAGAFVKSESYTGMVPGVKVKAVDTTAAGDVFNGALAVALAEGIDLKEAVVFANKAASISVTRLGAQASAPYRNEIKNC